MFARNNVDAQSKSFDPRVDDESARIVETLKKLQ